MGRSARAHIVRRKGIDGAAVIRTKVTAMMTGHGDDPVIDHGDDHGGDHGDDHGDVRRGRLPEFLMF